MRDPVNYLAHSSGPNELQSLLYCYYSVSSCGFKSERMCSKDISLHMSLRCVVFKQLCYIGFCQLSSTKIVFLDSQFFSENGFGNIIWGPYHTIC